MGVKEFFRSLFGKDARFTLDGSMGKGFACAVQETAVRELAFAAAANLIANTVSKCEFKTFFAGQEIKADEYYLWNVKPNVNESSSVFLQKLIYRLCFDGEALVVFDKPRSANGIQMFVTDTFSVKAEFALYPNVFIGVSANGYEFEGREFFADQALYFRLAIQSAPELGF